jgi:hypothetical protein
MHKQGYAGRYCHNKERIKNNDSQTYPKLRVPENAASLMNHHFVESIYTEKDQRKCIQDKKIQIMLNKAC